MHNDGFLTTVISVSPSLLPFCTCALYPTYVSMENSLIIMTYYFVVGFNCNIDKIKLCKSMSDVFLFFSTMLILLSNVPQTKPLHAV